MLLQESDHLMKGISCTLFLLRVRSVTPDGPAMVHARVELAVSCSLLLCKDSLDFFAEFLTDLWVLRSRTEMSHMLHRHSQQSADLQVKCNIYSKRLQSIA